MDSIYLEKATALLETADGELKTVQNTAELDMARNAAGKAWAALTEASRALFLSNGVREEELPKTHRGTRYMLQRFADRELQLIYLHAYEDVHQDAYYDGLINLDILRSRLSDIRRFIERVKEESR